MSGIRVSGIRVCPHWWSSSGGVNRFGDEEAWFLGA